MSSHPRHLGRYRIEQTLGQGQMGTVYLATDPAIDRAVAVKVLRARPELGPDEAGEWRARFEREVQVAAKLSHPNVVGVLDVGWEQDTMFIVMEYVEGTDLQAELERNGPLPTPRALEICEALAGALDEAHALGIVHRDLKPGNVLLRTDGTVKLTDFGVAHVADSRMTRTGMTYGTPAFMSPEQATAAVIGPASDQFSLAALLYFMLTGEVPFAGSSSAAVMYRLVNEAPVPPESLNPGVSAEFSRALLRALAKNPDDRYPTCAALARALQRAQCGERAAADEGHRPVAPHDAAGTRRPSASHGAGAPSGDGGRRGALAGAATVRETVGPLRSGVPLRPAVAAAAVLSLPFVGLLAWVYLDSSAAGQGAAAEGREIAPSTAVSGSGPAPVESDPSGPGRSSELEASRAGGSSGPGVSRPRGSLEPLEVGGSLPRNLSERTVNATQVLDDVRGMSDGIPARLLEEAYCVAVIPGVIKVGFGFAGRHGKGLVSCRAPGGWSPPSFVSLTGGSFGLQIGAQSTDFVLIFNRPNAARRLTENQLTLGGDASISAGPVGRTAEAGTDIRLKEEIFSYSRSKGLFAGISLEGATLRIDQDANREAYGRGVTPADLLLSRERSVTAELARFLSGLEAASN
ncbi:MAG TPA: YSC84-related protein [Acidobacteriota bacterium]